MLAAPVFWRTIRTSTLESPVMDSRNRLESSLYNIKGTILLRRCYAACNHFSFAIKYPNTFILHRHYNHDIMYSVGLISQAVGNVLHRLFLRLLNKIHIIRNNLEGPFRSSLVLKP